MRKVWVFHLVVCGTSSEQVNSGLLLPLSFSQGPYGEE